MKFQSERKRTAFLLDITPIVDTVFNLLIFFAVSLSFVVLPSIQINLPKSSSKQVTPDQRDLRVSITKKGELYLGDSKLDAQELFHEFYLAAGRSIDTEVLIGADHEVAHGRVVEVMDLASKAKLHRLAIITRRSEN